MILSNDRGALQIGVEFCPPDWARSGTRPGAAVRVAETGRVLLR